MIAVLFARRDSVYKTLPGVDVWDADRDARKWQGGHPVIAHPPCRSWGRLRTFAKPVEGEREMCVWAAEQVRQWGGVLEHPAGSLLWDAAGLPLPGESSFDGFTLCVSQWWWGHKADKKTWLYVSRVAMADLPEIPYRMGEPDFICGGSRRKDRPEITKAEREHTPVDLARWLIKVAGRVS